MCYDVTIVFDKSYKKKKAETDLFRKNGRPRHFCCWFVCAFCVCFLTLSAQGQYGGGNGTAQNPYLISEPNHLQAIGANSNDWGKHFKLMADIDLSGYTGTQFNLIGDYKLQ